MANNLDLDFSLDNFDFEENQKNNQKKLIVKVRKFCLFLVEFFKSFLKIISWFLPIFVFLNIIFIFYSFYFVKVKEKDSKLSFSII